MPIATQVSATSSGGVLDMARACFDLGDYDETIRLASDSLPALSENRERFRALLFIACSEACKGELRKSLLTLNLISAFVDELPAESQAKFYGQRAYAHSNLGNNDAALVDLAAVRYWAEECGDLETTARARNNLAKHHRQEKRFDEALAESEAAVRFAESFHDDVLRGQFYDRKAQILVDLKRFSEAVALSEKSLVLLHGHPSLIEARETHGRALIGLGVTYLEQDDPIATFAAKHRAAELTKCALNEELVQLALERSSGHVSKAASSLSVNHKAVIKFVNARGIDRVPAVSRLKSFTKEK